MDVETIDGLNIYHATHAAMCAAVKKLGCAPSAVLVDGNRLPKFDIPAEALVGGDALSMSIAAASIIAKVTRDRIMRELALNFPLYGWERNKGYGTSGARRGAAGPWRDLPSPAQLPAGLGAAGDGGGRLMPARAVAASLWVRNGRRNSPDWE